jgi:membrane associated rhomboid family serine protease
MCIAACTCLAHALSISLLAGAFCHGSFDHLSGNLFFLLTFGKAVESEERAAGVWLAYLACGVGSALASWLLLPAVSRGVPVVSLGASGAVFGTCQRSRSFRVLLALMARSIAGLFVISVLTKLTSFDWRKLLEAGILGTFVWERIWSEISITTQGGGIGASNVNHVAHLAGALCGVLLIALLNRALPPLGDDGDDDSGGAARRLKE